MKYKHFYLCDDDGKSNCVIRSLCKIYNKSYKSVYNELCLIAKNLHSTSFNDIEVFEEYMKRNNTFPVNYGKNFLIKDLELEKGEYIVFCWDKKDFYHMVSIINNVLYDYNQKSLELYVITIYKKNI